MKEAKKVKGVYEKVPGSGVWWVRYADASGRIRREMAGVKSAAITLYRKRKTEVLQRKKLPENFRVKPIAFQELADDALEYSKAHKRSYKQDVYRMATLKEAFGTRPADTITPQDLERWLADASEDSEWQPATVNRFKALLSLVFRLGIENGKTHENPARVVRRRRENNARLRYLSDDEEKRLRAVIQRDYPWHLPEFEIGLHTGMRCSEQYGLRWDDVDLANRVVTIRLSKHGETRHVRLNPVARATFQQLFERSQGSDVVFTNSRKEPLLKPRHWFEPALETANVKEFTWHCLRHTFASRLVMKGADLRSVQAAMGHKTIQMTCRYAHLAPDHEQSVVDMLCETGNGKEREPEEATDTKSDTNVSEATASGTVGLEQVTVHV